MKPIQMMQMKLRDVGRDTRWSQSKWRRWNSCKWVKQTEIQVLSANVTMLVLLPLLEFSSSLGSFCTYLWLLSWFFFNKRMHKSRMTQIDGAIKSVAEPEANQLHQAANLKTNQDMCSVKTAISPTMRNFSMKPILMHFTLNKESNPIGIIIKSTRTRKIWILQTRGCSSRPSASIRV